MPDILSPTGIEKPLGGELHSRAQYLRNLDRINQVAADTAKQSTGRVLNSSAVSNSGAVGATQSVVNNIGTFTFKAGREYSIIWDFEFYGDTTNAYFEFTIATCAVTDAAGLITGLTDRIKRIRSVQQGGAAFYDSARVEAPITFGVDTTLQIKFLVQLVANAGNCVVIGSSIHPALYVIEDKGDQI